jgi:hypothetical protein
VEAPILRATAATGEVYDDPSEDALFMLIEDLDSAGASVLVERVEEGREREAVRVTLQDSGSYRFEGRETHEGSMRAVHEALTRWAFDLPEWREPLVRPSDEER